MAIAFSRRRRDGTGPAVVGDAVRRVGEGEVGLTATEGSRDVLGPGRVAAHQPVVAHCPGLAACGPRRASRLLERRVEVEALGPVALLAGGEAPQQVADLVLPEARQAEVGVGRLPQFAQQPGQELLVPRARRSG